jgi:uncharacterized protein (TIGR02996 family)
MTWPAEKTLLRTRAERAERAAQTWSFNRTIDGLAKIYPEDEALRLAVIEHPDDDAPRRAYAAWMKAQSNENARVIASLIEDQLKVAEAFRADPRADVSAVYADWLGRAHFRTPAVPHGYDLELLMMEGLIGHPAFYRGFVEDVVMRTHRFLELADELFSLAPIRHIGLVDAPASIAALAASPHLARMRSLTIATLDEHHDAHLLTDDMIERLLDSPYLGNIAHLRLGGQTKLTQRSYERIVTAKSLPMLSNFEVYTDGSSSIWQETIRPNFDQGHLTYFQRVMKHYPQTQDLRDTPKSVVLRSEDWIVELERALGYVPCVHPEEHYGHYIVDVEAVVAHPIAADPAVMARRGQPVPDPGPKPSLMERRRRGHCAICDSPELTFVPDPTSDADLYAGPGDRGTITCARCGTVWDASQWPEFHERAFLAFAAAAERAP